MASVIPQNIKRIIRILIDGGKADDVRDYLVKDFRKKLEAARIDVATYERLISENTMERPDLKASLSVRRAQLKELQQAIDLMILPGSLEDLPD